MTVNYAGNNDYYNPSTGSKSIVVNSAGPNPPSPNPNDNDINSGSGGGSNYGGGDSFGSGFGGLPFTGIPLLVLFVVVCSLVGFFVKKR